ncbi:L-asparaginase type II [Penicillium concentricum]|uniref:asparaginase n=1 Tax=Penicillium concentricum TaxID=293559 RepID=A0A9W9V889_9EURO|nr:L-asparaginase type II [Penicillium concentricum]KAJ5372447.1 L-asparaginase type II [Penicillium concentricum]
MGLLLQTLVVSALAITSYASPWVYSRAAHTSRTNSNGLTFNHFNSSLPNVTILATGGTIAGTSNDKTATAGYESDALGINSLLSEIPDIFNVANIAAVQAKNVNSGDIPSSLPLNLTHRVQIEVCDDPTMSGAVITHGTDTLEESAFFIDATGNCGKPIVFVSSMRPSTAISADGPMNLLQGVTIPADKNSKDRGALVVTNDRIVSAFFATKTNANTMDTFKAYEQGSMGFIVSNKPYFYYTAVQPIAKHVADVSDVDAVPRVDILYAYEDMQVDSIYSAVKNGAKGVVVAGEGAGGVSTDFASAINDIVAKHNIPLCCRTVLILLGLLLAEKKGLEDIRGVFLKATVA